MRTGGRNINERCDLLEAMGFEINHTDSNVWLAGYHFDFSAINLSDMKSVLRHTITTVSRTAKAEGSLETINNMRDVLRLGPLAGEQP